MSFERTQSRDWGRVYMSDLKEKRQEVRETEKKKAEDEAELNPKQYLELRSMAIRKLQQTTRPGSTPARISGQYHIEGDRRGPWHATDLLPQHV
jgi:hypothetical protein